jgi:hypothetical protein
MHPADHKNRNRPEISRTDFFPESVREIFRFCAARFCVKGNQVLVCPEQGTRVDISGCYDRILELAHI